MGFVEEWQKPLEEALEKMLRGPGLSAKELEEVRQTMGRMDCSQKLTELLELKEKQQDQEFMEVAAQIEHGSDSAVIAAARDKMMRLSGYKNADEKIALAEKRIKELKAVELIQEQRKAKRARKITIIAAAVFAVCFAAGIAVLIVRGQQRSKKIEEIKTQILAMIDQGNEAEIGDLLKDLTDLNAGRNDLYEVSEKALESVAGREGFAAAFALRDALAEEVDGAVDADAFGKWADEQFTSGAVSPEEGWVIAQDALATERLKETSEVVVNAFNACLESVLEKAQSGDTGDLMTWISGQKTYMTSLPVNPDLAIKACRTIDEAGNDSAAVFPDGILVDIPVGSNVAKLNEWLGIEDNSYTSPNMTKMLPVSIVEKQKSSVLDMCDMPYPSEAELISAIEDLQKRDAHYTVMFLPKYYKSMPEDLRADTFAECTCLVAMQKSYYLRGCTYKEETKGTSFSKRTSDYRGYFTAVDCVAFYDPANPEYFMNYSLEAHEPIVAMKGWYDANKNSSDLIFNASSYMLGAHDDEALNAEYEKAIENLSIIKIVTEMSESGEEEENGNI